MGKVKKSKRVIVFCGIFSLLVVIGLSVYLIFFLKKDPLDGTLPPALVVTDFEGDPSEEIPSDYYVPPDLPKRIIIPSIEVNGYIQLVGIDKANRIAVPNNVHIAGWYINSVKPGEVGLSIVDGHRDGIRTTGIFRNLEDVKKDDTLSIEYGDGTVRNFVVLDVKVISIEEAFDIMYEKREGVEKQLNLVSCGGKFNKLIKTYDDRIIVIAKGI